MILRHRDTEVLRFDWLEPSGVRVVSVNGAVMGLDHVTYGLEQFN